MFHELGNKRAVAIFIGVTKLFKALNSNDITLKFKNILNNHHENHLLYKSHSWSLSLKAISCKNIGIFMLL